MKAIFSALSFLTVLPVPGRLAGEEADLRRGLFFFPWVGLLIGGVVAAIGFGLGHVLSTFPATVLVVLALVAATRALHMDGLADTFDAFLSSRSRERMLEIMRDSRTGSMGVLAVAGILLLKTSFLFGAGGPLRWQVVLLMPVAGRCALLMVMGIFPYARPEGGLATAFTAGRRSALFLAAWAAVFALAAGWLLASWMGLTAGAASIGVALLFGLYSSRKIGGFTGDTLGAACEITESIPALVAALWI